MKSLGLTMLRIKAFYFFNIKIAFAVVVFVIVTNTYPSFNISLAFPSIFWNIFSAFGEY